MLQFRSNGVPLRGTAFVTQESQREGEQSFSAGFQYFIQFFKIFSRKVLTLSVICDIMIIENDISDLGI